MKQKLLVMALVIIAMSTYAEANQFEKTEGVYEVKSAEDVPFRISSDTEWDADPIEQGAYEGFLRLVDEYNRKDGKISNYVDKSTNKISKTFDKIDLVPIAQYTENGKFYDEGNLIQNLNRDKLYFHSVHKLITEGIKEIKESGRINEVSSILLGNAKRFYFGDGNTVNNVVIRGKENFENEVKVNKDKNNVRYYVDGKYSPIKRARNQLDISMADYHDKIKGKAKGEVNSYLKEKMIAQGINVIEKDGELYTREADGSEWKVYWTIEPVSIPQVDTTTENRSLLKNDIYTRIYTYTSTQRPDDSAGKVLYTQNGDIILEDKYDYINGQTRINTDGWTMGAGKKGTFLTELIEKAKTGGSASPVINEYYEDKNKVKSGTMTQDEFNAKWVTPFERGGAFEQDMQQLQAKLNETIPKRDAAKKRKDEAQAKLDTKFSTPPLGFFDFIFLSEAELENYLVGKTEFEKEYVTTFLEKRKAEEEYDKLEEKIQYEIPKEYGVYAGHSTNPAEKKWLKYIIDERNIVLTKLGKRVDFRGKGVILGIVDFGEGSNTLTISGQLTGRYGTNIILGPYSKLKNIDTVYIGRDRDGANGKGANTGTTSLTLDIDPSQKNTEGHLVQHAFKDSDKNIIFLQKGKSLADERRDEFDIQLMASRIGTNSIINMGRNLEYTAKDIVNTRDVKMKIDFVSDSIGHYLYKLEEKGADGNSLIKVDVKDKIKRLSDSENEAYKSIVDSGKLGMLHPTLTSTNKKTTFSYRENSGYEKKKIEFANYVRTKTVDDIVTDLSEFYLNDYEQKQAKQHVDALSLSKKKYIQAAERKIEDNKKAVQDRISEKGVIEGDIALIHGKIDALNADIPKVAEMKTTSQYTHLAPETRINLYNTLNLDGVYTYLDGYTDYVHITDQATDDNYIKLKQFSDNIGTTIPDITSLKAAYPNFEEINIITEKYEEIIDNLNTYTGTSWKKFTAGPLKRATIAARTLKNALASLMVADESLKSKIEKIKKDELEPKNKSLDEKKQAIIDAQELLAKETLDVLYSKSLEDDLDYQKLRDLLYYTLREDEALRELKELLSQMQQSNIYSKVNKIAKNEIATYTNIPFDINQSLSKKTRYARGGFISATTVQDNFKGNTYTAYALYEQDLNDQSRFGFMVGGANTNHELTHNKRSATTTPTTSTVKGVSGYLGAYYGHNLYEELDWITGVGAQYGSYDVKRHLKNNYQGLDSKGDVKVGTLNTYTGLVLNYPLQEDVAVQLKGILSYTYVNQGKVNEKDGLALDIQAKDYHYVDSEVGVSLNKTLYNSDHKNNLSAGISAITGIAGYKNDDLSAKVKGSTSSFKIKGDKIKKDAVKLFIDYNVQMDAGFNYGLEGTYISNSAESNVKIGIKAGYAF